MAGDFTVVSERRDGDRLDRYHVPSALLACHKNFYQQFEPCCRLTMNIQIRRSQGEHV